MLSKKAAQLGFPGLTEQSSPTELGAAIVQHWNEKITSSQVAQGITYSYESILLKTIRAIVRTVFAVKRGQKSYPSDRVQIRNKAHRMDSPMEEIVQTLLSKVGDFANRN